MHLLSCLRGSLKGKALFQSKYPTFKFSLRTFKKKKPEPGGINLPPDIKCSNASQERVVLVFPVLAKTFTFTAVFCGSVFVGASIWNYENNKHLMSHKALMDYAKYEWNKRTAFEHKEVTFRKSLNKWWNSESEGKKIFWVIFAINIFAFTFLKYAASKGTLIRYFYANPFEKVVCWPMFLSNFMHLNILHLSMNMFALHSFSNALGGSLGKEQFVALYLAGGVVSSFASSSYRLLSKRYVHSVGSSGAIMAVLGYFCVSHKDSQLAFFLLPNYPFSAETGFKGLMLMDFLGLVFKWRWFDHAAHLGGAVFGLLYALYGQRLIWENRSSVNKIWGEFSKKYLNKKE